MTYRAIRLLITLALTFSLLMALLPAHAQGPTTLHRIGVLWLPSASAEPASEMLFEAFLQGLRDLGYVAGQNLAVEHRYGETPPA